MENLVFIHTRKWYEVDPRIKFLIAVIAGFIILFVESELSLITAFMTALIWCLYCGKWKNTISLTIVYIILYLWAYYELRQENVSAIIIPLVLFRRFLIIGTFMTPLFATDIGEIVGAINKLKLPRFFTLSMVIVFRFIPTIKEEYQSVRTSQKFRGIGRHIFNIIVHPIIFYETLIVPLAIRIMRISDELSASAILRGADKSNNASCFRDVRIHMLDYLTLICVVAMMLLSVYISMEVKI